MGYSESNPGINNSDFTFPRNEKKEVELSGNKIEVGETIVSTDGKRFKLVSKLGEGGMGKVYKAEELRAIGGEDVGIEKAVKFIHKRKRGDSALQRRIDRQFELLRDIDAKFILKTLDVIEVEEDGEMVTGYVAELIDGPSLSKEIKEHGKMQPERVLKIIGQILIALETLRERGVVHRDLKPENIALEQFDNGDETVKILDFDLVGFDQDDQSNIAEENFPKGERDDVTVVGSRVGTPQYTSPENYLRRPITHKSDLYSVGLTMYEMLSGKRAFDMPPEQAKVAQLTKYPEELGKLGVEVPNWIEAVVYNLIAKDSADRIGSAAELFQFIKTGVKKDYPKLLNEPPFMFDIKKTDSEKKEDLAA